MKNWTRVYFYLTGSFTSAIFRLFVADAYAIINGSPELHIKNGSEMHLICKFMQSTEEPSFVFWYHEDVMISFDQYRGINTGKNKTGSTLSISSINHSHSGNYSCVPSNTRPASILVHILDGKVLFMVWIKKTFC